MRRAWVILALVLIAPAAVRAERTIGADDYLDRLRGMWLGELLGNYAGRATEGLYRIRGGNPAETAGFVFGDPWDGDDDTCFEYLYMTMLTGDPQPTHADIRTAWADHVPLTGVYIANLQASYLIAAGGTVPDSGSYGLNMHAYAIDSQITTEALGAAAPGMRQRAADLAGQFGAVSNEGFSLHAAQFYAAMYAAAPFETDVEDVVASGLAVVPATSRTHEIVQDVRDWYAADAADASLDWRATHGLIYDKYVGVDSVGRYRNWIESSVNTALTTLAILYGQGDFKETVRIGVLGGFDSDCNPATAGGLVGLMNGYSGLPSDLTSQASDDYAVGILQGTATLTTIRGIAAGWQACAEAQILLAGGSITGSGAARTYHLPDDPVAAPPERPDRTGPRGLVRGVQDLGGSVAVTASVAQYVATDERRDLDAVIDGVTDVTYNGHVPYTTDDGDNSQPAGGDFYQLGFDRDCVFTSLIFHEGDIIWSSINGNPKTTPPRGGYFEDLTVEVGDDGVFTEVTGLALSEPLSAFDYYQHIALTFDAATGDAVRIRGSAGGTWEFTSIVELEAFGTIPGWLTGDATHDGHVNIFDLAALANHYGSPDAGLADGDFNLDGVVDVFDLALLANHYGQSTGRPIPAPPIAALLLIALPLIRRRRFHGEISTYVERVTQERKH